MKRLQKIPPKIPDASESLPELLIHCHPGNFLGLARRDAMQPLGQPGINISAIEDDDRTATARWSSGTACLPRLWKYSSLKPDRRGPQHALVGFFREPQVKSGNDLRIDLDRPPLLHHAHADGRRGQSGKLVFQSLQLPAIGFQAKRAGEGGHRILDIDDRIDVRTASLARWIRTSLGFSP